MGLNGMDVIVKLATLDEFDDVNYLNQTIWLWQTAQDISKIVILGVGPIIFIVTL